MKNCKESFLSFIKQCDLFGKPISFKYNNDIEYKSIIGGINTIFFIILSLIYIMYMSYRFILRKDINFIYSTKIVSEGAFLNLTEINFNLAFGIQFTENGTNAIEYSKKYIEYSITSNEWNGGTDNITYFVYDFNKCNFSDFPVETKTLFYKNKLNLLYCPVLNNSVNFTLYGGYTDIYYKFIEIKFKLTEYAKKNSEEVNQYFSKYPIEMIIYFMDTGIDYKLKNNPISLYINSVNRWLEYSIKKETQVFFSPFEFDDDENLFISNAHTTKGSMFDRTQDTFHYVTEKDLDNTIGSFLVKASSKVIQYDRSYQKIPSFIADVSSIIEELLTLIILLVDYCEKILMDKNLIQKSFKFKGSKYYDMEYLTSSFHKDKINFKIMTLITKHKLDIHKTHQLLSNNNKTNDLINEIRKSKTIIKKPYLLDNIKSYSFKNKKIQSEVSELQNSNSNADFMSSHFDNKLKNNFDNISKISKSSFKNYKVGFKNVKINDFENKIEIKEKKKKTLFNLSKKKNEKNNKKNNENFDLKYLNIIDIITSKIFSCFSNKLKMKNFLFEKCKQKMYYYLDIFVYIKKIQEIDLIKYCLLDNDQLILFNYLSSPPIKFNKTQKSLYKEFENLQTNYKFLDKREIDKLIGIYKKICNKNQLNFEDIKLLRLVNAEIDFFK